jgi:hypothetical protein
MVRKYSRLVLKKKANKSAELYPYMRFIGAHWAGDFEDFKRKFGDIEDARSPILNVPLASQYLTLL